MPGLQRDSRMLIRHRDDPPLRLIMRERLNLLRFLWSARY